MRRNVLASTAAAALAAAALVAAGPATNAQAAACNNDFVGGPNNSDGSLQAVSGAAWHKGPGANYCTLTPRSGLAYAYCKRNSANGNLWYLARDASSSQVGWIWAGNVSSTKPTINHC